MENRNHHHHHHHHSVANETMLLPHGGDLRLWGVVECNCVHKFVVKDRLLGGYNVRAFEQWLWMYVCKQSTEQHLLSMPCCASIIYLPDLKSMIWQESPWHPCCYRLAQAPNRYLLTLEILSGLNSWDGWYRRIQSRKIAISTFEIQPELTVWASV